MDGWAVTRVLTVHLSYVSLSIPSGPSPSQSLYHERCFSKHVILDTDSLCPLAQLSVPCRRAPDPEKAEIAVPLAGRTTARQECAAPRSAVLLVASRWTGKQDSWTKS